MNLNSLLKYQSALYQDKLKEAIKVFLNPERALYAEDKEQLQSFIDTFPENASTFFKPDLVSVRDRSTKEGIVENINRSYAFLFIINKLIAELSKEHQKLSGYETSKLNDLLKLQGSIKQKLASLKLASGEYKFSWAESFETLEHLIVNDRSLLVSGGYITLPVENTEDIVITSLSIGKSSVGRLGSSDENFTNVNDLNELLSNKNIQWEEIENNYAVLELEINFANEQIANALLIKFLPVVNIDSALVKSIRAYSKGTLVELLEDPVKISSQDLIIPFYPVSTSKLVVRIEQSKSYELLVDNLSAVHRTVISLDKLIPKRIKYVSEGAIESKTIEILGMPTAAKADISFSKTNQNLFSFNFLYSIDNQASFLDYKTIGAFLGIESLHWKLLLKRNDNAFVDNSSVHEEEQEFEYDTQLNYVSGFRSPTSFSLRSKPINDNITILQPRVLRRGGKKKELQIGTGTGGSLRIKLGMVLTPELAEDASIRVNGELWTYAETLVGAGASDKKWTLNKDDYQHIIFGDDTNGLAVPDKARVTFSLDLESLNFEQVKDGYYAEFDYLFDPDKDNISLIYVSESELAGKAILERNKKINQLPYKNIVESSVKISEKTKAGSSYTSKIFVTLKTFVDGSSELTSSGDYSIDYKNGYIYSYSLIPNDDIVTVSFSFYPTKEIDKKNFSVIFKTAKPKGVLISKSSFPAKEVTDTVAASIGTKIKILTVDGLRELDIDKPTADTNSFPLSRRGPIKGTIDVSDLFTDTSIVSQEVEYIDGHTEFLGLIKVVNEKTSAFSGSGIKSFIVDAGTNFYSPLGISFDDNTYFLTEKSSLGAVTTAGDWFVDSATGTVSVYVSAGLPADITYSYYYRDNDFDPTNKFSVNYKKGIVFSYTGWKTNASITYKVANFYAIYDIATQIEDFDFDKQNSLITVKTENNFDDSKLIKIIYPIKTNDLNVEDLRSYYSPIIRSLTFRFS